MLTKYCQGGRNRAQRCDSIGQSLLGPVKAGQSQLLATQTKPRSERQLEVAAHFWS